MRIGIDVGGTNTDAVLMGGPAVLAKVKTATTSDVTGGIVTAIESLLSSSGVSHADLAAVMIGTTHFTNAIVERRRLAPTAILRVGLPATLAVEPFEDWPADLRSALGGEARLAHGGNEFDGGPWRRLTRRRSRGSSATWWPAGSSRSPWRRCSRRSRRRWSGEWARSSRSSRRGCR
jgi:N-methylhydantoinase A/oxoprolinase/acetone carboxylase beta subunit